MRDGFAWSTYRLSDFLSYSPDVLSALFEGYNLSIWPAQVVWVIGNLVFLCFLFRFALGKTLSTGVRRGMLAFISSAWLWCGIVYLEASLSEIDPVARYFAIAFGIQSGLVAYAATKNPHLFLNQGYRRLISLALAYSFSVPLVFLTEEVLK